MNDILKQRLIGALILIALGVVFWPIIFIEQEVKPLGEAAQIPVRPRVDTTPLQPPDKVGLRQSPPIEASSEMELAPPPQVLPEAKADTRAPVEKSVVTTKATTPAESLPRTRTEPPVRPAIDADGVPIGWILQIASVSNPDKAEALRKRLIEMGYKAYVKKIKTGNAVLLRVYVGPKFERARLESMQPKVDAEFEVKSLVRRYIP